MNIMIRAFEKQDITQMIAIWNEVVEEGDAFPQMNELNEENGYVFFKEQSFSGVAVNEENQEIVGLYILHPNNIGRCGHICNASYAVKKGLRGLHIGEQLVKDCMAQGKKIGFKILQFNAVVATNTSALHLYEKLGFIKLGAIEDGFLKKDGTYEAIIPHYHRL